MPAFNGPTTINNITGSAIVEFGNTVFVSPKFTSKTYHGSGSSNTAGQITTINEVSSTNTEQVDLIDHPISGNG